MSDANSHRPKHRRRVNMDKGRQVHNERKQGEPLSSGLLFCALIIPLRLNQACRKEMHLFHFRETLVNKGRDSVQPSNKDNKRLCAYCIEPHATEDEYRVHLSFSPERISRYQPLESRR